jgi:hypothetical protein
MGREYRVFLYLDRVLGFGYYWEGDDPLRNLLRRGETNGGSSKGGCTPCGSPYVIVDVGQVKAEWIVIEVGDVIRWCQSRSAATTGVQRAVLRIPGNLLRRSRCAGETNLLHNNSLYIYNHSAPFVSHCTPRAGECNRCGAYTKVVCTDGVVEI